MFLLKFYRTWSLKVYLRELNWPISCNRNGPNNLRLNCLIINCERNQLMSATQNWFVTEALVKHDTEFNNKNQRGSHPMHVLCWDTFSLLPSKSMIPTMMNMLSPISRIAISRSLNTAQEILQQMYQPNNSTHNPLSLPIPSFRWPNQSQFDHRRCTKSVYIQNLVLDAIRTLGHGYPKLN